MTERPLNFATAQERQDWIIQNADHFVTCRRIGGHLLRQEHKTLELARDFAKGLLIQNASKPVLIYAVKDTSDTYVEMVKP
jgi:hypothetical protein